MSIYPIRYQFKTALGKEAFLSAVKESAATGKLLGENVYLKYYAQNHRHYVEPRHNKPTRELPLKIEIAVEDLEHTEAKALVTLKFRLTSVMEWFIAGAFTVYMLLFVLAVIGEQAGVYLKWPLKWLFLAAAVTGITLFPLFFYATVGRYVGVIRRL